MTQEPSSQEQPKPPTVDELLPVVLEQLKQLMPEFVLQSVHLKYNVYLLTQSIIFASIVGRCKNNDEAVALTTQITRALDASNNQR